MTKEDEQVVHRRRGWWIRVAREGRGMTLAAFAETLGYLDGQGTVSLWEKGLRPVPSSKFPAIAELLGLPDRFLVRPPSTDEERLAAAVRAAEELEREDWEAGERPHRAADDGPGAEPGRRSA
jgi:transcriptional regulator with XRE-family HTH domain